MKARSVLLLVISAVLGIIAIVLVKGLVQPQGSPTAAMAIKKVVVAATMLKFGDKLTALSLREVNFPLSSVPEGTFDSVAELTAGELRVALEPIYPGEPVLAAKISGRGGKGTLSTVIDPAMRAVTIRVDDVSGTAGFITPSDRVDVLLTRTEKEATAQATPQTDVLLQNIRVLAIDQEANERKDKPTVVKAVTLEVTPDEAQEIALARTIGTLSLALRNLTNSAAVPTRSIFASDLPGAHKQAEPAPPPPPPPPPAALPRPAAPYTLQIIRGSAATTYDINRNGGEVSQITRNPAVAPHP